MDFRRVTIISIAVLVLLPVGLVGCGGSEHTSSSGQAQSSAQATADLIRATERQRLHALLHHDFDTAQLLHADDFELINPLGETESKEAYIDSGAAFEYTVFKPMSPIRVRVHGDWAIIRYKSEIELHGTRGRY